MGDTFSPLTEDILYCHQNDLLDDDLGKAIYQIYHAGVCDETIANMVKRRVSKNKLNKAFNDCPPFKNPKLTKGDYVIGLDPNGTELYSQIQFLNAHSLTVAGSGAGKTTFSYFKILQIAQHIDGLFLFDLRKREFRKLKSYLARIGINLRIIPARNLRINPLQLPLGVTFNDWNPRVADMLVSVLELPPRASKLLQAKLFLLYQHFNAEKNEFPTLFDLYEAIKRDKEGNYQARIAILDSLEPVLLSLGPNVLAYHQGWSSSDMAHFHLVFELAGVSETDKNLLLNSLILSEFTSRIARGISNPGLNLLIFLDEAQRLCDSTSKISAIADLIGLIRGTGIGLDLSVQSTNRILPEVLSNTSTKILGRCGSMADYSAAGSSMGLSAEEIHWSQMHLKPGMFIGQLGEGQWRYPFVFSVPPMNLPSHQGGGNETDSSLNLLTIPASEFRHWGQPPEVNSVPTPEMTAKKNLFDTPQEFQFCKAVVENPMLPSSKYIRLAGIKQNSAKQIREGLIRKNYICQHTVDTTGKGRSSLLLEALLEGIQAVNEYEGSSK